MLLPFWGDRRGCAGTIPSAVKGLTSLANWSFFGNALADCGLRDVSAVDCSALLAASASWGVFAGRTGSGACGDAMSPAAWPGVACNSAGRVVGLDLGSKGLSGPLPAALGNLSALTALSLRNNSIIGTVPVSLSSLVSLRRALIIISLFF